MVWNGRRKTRSKSRERRNNPKSKERRIRKEKETLGNGACRRKWERSKE